MRNDNFTSYNQEIHVEIHLSGMIVDIINRIIFPGTIFIQKGEITEIRQDAEALTSQYILPGFVDAHIHIESSLLIPSEFARLAVVHGTVGTVSDPHEIGNVLGLKGVQFMINNGKKVPFNFYFGASSCVPATLYETAGAQISLEDIERLFDEEHLKYLSEVMNYPDVLSQDPPTIAKLEAAKKRGLKIDGHAPGLSGKEARNYINAGISTDHECTELEEALEKISYGMKILIREGSAAKNFEKLHPILKKHPGMTMFCSDDKHPHELTEGHINKLVTKSLKLGYDFFDILRVASFNPIQHYGLDIGLLRPGDQADFIVIDNPADFNILKTYIKGELVAQNGKSLIKSIPAETINHFACHEKAIDDFKITPESEKIHVIEVIQDQLLTNDLILKAKLEDNFAVSNIKDDILKLAVINRYFDAKPALGFVKNFGLKRGALASCIAHDSHNIIAVGVSDEELCKAVNLVIKNKGGLALIDHEQEISIPLPIAGIMCAKDGYQVAKEYKELELSTKRLGTTLKDPFMTLSFMALLVIPHLKLSDKGLFDVDQFKFVSISA